MNEIHSEFCANCGNKAVRLVDGKEKPTVWCNIQCQNEWIDSLKKENELEQLTTK